MRKTSIFFMALILVSVLFLSACSDKGNVGSEPDAGDTTENTVEDTTEDTTTSNLTPAGEYPIVKEPITLKVLIAGQLSELDKNLFTKWYEELTNVHLEFEYNPEGMDTNSTLGLVMSSGELPDVIIGFGLTPTQQLLYGQQGLIVDMSELIEKYGKNTKEMFAKYPGVKDALTAPGGKIYALPQINDCYHCSMHQKAWIYQPWLDKLGLEMPQTQEEFYEVLKAFKTKDPNGNGKADEIPLAGVAAGKSFNSGIDRYLMDSFVNNNQFTGAPRLSLNNGKIEADFTKPEWKQGLEWVHKLYAEGLIAPESFTMDVTQMKQLSYQDGNVIVGVIRGGGPSGSFPLFDETTNGAGWGYVAVPPLEGPIGRSTPWNPYPTPRGTGEFIITSANKHLEETIRWADGFYALDVTFRSVQGVPGERYNILDRKDPNKIGLDGKPALWESIGALTAEDTKNTHWNQVGLGFRDIEYTGGQAADEGARDQVDLFQSTLTKYEPYKQKMETIVPPLFFNEEQALELADMSTTINSYVNEMFARFVTGDADINNEWESYLKELDKMNLKRYLEIYQEAYDSKAK